MQRRQIRDYTGAFGNELAAVNVALGRSVWDPYFKSSRQYDESALGIFIMYLGQRHHSIDVVP